MYWLTGGLFLATACFCFAEEEKEADRAESVSTMTLGTKGIRNSMDRIGGDWPLPQAIPDLRLTLRRPDLQSVREMNPDLSLQGIEVQLPMKGLWVGVANDEEDGPRRATVSLQRRF